MIHKLLGIKKIPIIFAYFFIFFNVTYNYTDTFGCSNTNQQSTEVFQVLPVDFTGLLSSYCVNSNASILIGTPSGGVFSGNSINSPAIFRVRSSCCRENRFLLQQLKQTRKIQKLMHFFFFRVNVFRSRRTTKCVIASSLRYRQWQPVPSIRCSWIPIGDVHLFLCRKLHEIKNRTNYGELTS